MNITRQNYEEYFLLYVDNELSIADRKSVDAFIQQYPDLQEELKALQRSIIRVDKQVHFGNKEALLKNVAGNPVNEANYEEYFVLYGDDELTSQEKEQVEQFVYKHPQYQAEFELILQARLIPDNTINFPDKTYLYRTEDAGKVVAFRWWRVVAAAVIILFLGGASLYLIRNQRGPNNDTNTNIAKKIDTGSSVAGTSKNQATEKTNVTVVTPGLNTDSNKGVANNKAERKAGINNSSKNNDLNNFALDKNNIKKDSNIILPKNVQQENEDVAVNLKPSGLDAEGSSGDAKYIVSARPEINANNLIAQTEPVADTSPNDNTVDDQYNQTDNRKNKMRGLFRKVTRVFDKATNTEPSENGRSGVRIASFAVALK